MRKWKITIKEVNNPNPVVSHYYGNVGYEFLQEWYGCEEPDVEWYTIEQED